MKIIKEIGRNPNVDWIIILSLTIGIILALGFMGFALYNAVTHGSIQGSGATKKATFEKLDEKTITSVISRFADKTDATAKAKAGYTASADPSI